MARPPLGRAAVVSFLAIVGCQEQTLVVDNVSDSGVDGEAGRPEEGDGGDESRPDGDSGGEEGPRAGPLTFVIAERELLTERLCDLDGDGDLDNSLADVGEPGASLIATALSSMTQSVVESGAGPMRQIVHFPWVDDVREPRASSATVIVSAARDDDDPPDVTDDFEPDERYLARWLTLDPCGEPAFYAEDVSIDDRHFSGSLAALGIPMGSGFLIVRDSPFAGSFESDGERLELDLSLCGSATAEMLAAVIPNAVSAPDLSLLEVLLAGGAPLGMPAVPGLTADLDLDGDGLELFELDDDGHLVRCVDGDSTVIDGRTCVADDRIADGFSLVAAQVARPVLFAGLEPGWEDLVSGACDEPPERSLWDPGST